MFPDLPKCHGHVFFPSWEYNGVGAEVINSCMKSRVIDDPSEEKLTQVVKDFWCSILPSDLWPKGECKYPSGPVEQCSISNPFRAGHVNSVARLFRLLASTGVDKCSGRLVFMCPARFQQLYEQTFGVNHDPVHYEKLYNSPEEEVSRLRKVHRDMGLEAIASLHRGSVPTPYFLVKLKDILAE